jgi:hypothetical protein
VIERLNGLEERHAALQSERARLRHENRVSQLLSNLAGNAVRRSPPGTPVLMRIDGRRDDALEAEVRNAGLGVPSELRDVLFEPFRGRERSPGFGLGLFICQQVVTAHGGTIEFASSDQAGTCFRISLPRHTNLGGGGHSRTGKGSASAAEVILPPSEARRQRGRECHRRGTDDQIADGARCTGAASTNSARCDRALEQSIFLCLWTPYTRRTRHLRRDAGHPRTAKLPSPKPAVAIA